MRGLFGENPVIKFVGKRKELLLLKKLTPEEKKLQQKRERQAEFDKEENNQPRKKKSLGQHFLRKQSVVDRMIDKVTITPETSVLEIGCGDGFLTSAILAQTKCKELRVYEIDSEWAQFVRNKIRDPRLNILRENILEINFENELASQKPWVILANLPYQITFPILFLFQQNKHLFTEGVVMIQEEVAHKIVAQQGRTYSPTSLFLQHHFTLELLDKVEPAAFTPPPKVFSRTLYFKSRHDVPEIPDEDGFWKFLKLCFKSPRQTLRNNLRSTHYYESVSKMPGELLSLRAQQITFDQFLEIWTLLGQESLR